VGFVGIPIFSKRNQEKPQFSSITGHRNGIKSEA
jgi:hypothetical protein